VQFFDFVNNIQFRFFKQHSKSNNLQSQVFESLGFQRTFVPGFLKQCKEPVGFMKELAVYGLGLRVL
jgi:hypothetical protein